MNTVKRGPKRLVGRGVPATPRERRMNGQQRAQELRENPEKLRDVLLHCAASPSPANDALAFKLGYNEKALDEHFMRHRVVGDVIRRMRSYGVSSYDEASREFNGEPFENFAFSRETNPSMGISRGSVPGVRIWRWRRGCAI